MVKNTWLWRFNLSISVKTQPTLPSPPQTRTWNWSRCSKSFSPNLGPEHIRSKTCAGFKCWRNRRKNLKFHVIFTNFSFRLYLNAFVITRFGVNKNKHWWPSSRIIFRSPFCIIFINGECCWRQNRGHIRPERAAHPKLFFTWRMYSNSAPEAARIWNHTSIKILNSKNWQNGAMA